MSDYRAVNRASWDERVPAHAASPDYAVDRFVEDPGFLSDVVRFDLPRLGDVAGARGVHLQCHIGTDTISLARLGARMTGVDFSARRSRRRPPWPSGSTWPSTSWRPTSTTPSTGCAPSGSSASSPASGRSAGCRTSAAG